MNRKFGIELEIVGITREMVKQALRAVNIRVEVEGYNHASKKHWKIVPDGSVQGGFEVVSPILKGEAGLEEAEIVARALEDAGAYANKSCGFHVHFDASELSANLIRKIILRYFRHEAEIDSFMPPSRRGNANQYCHSLHDLPELAFEAASTIPELAAIQPSRYYKVNIKAFQNHGTLEFRHHSGTVNALKICNWIRFLSEFIDECGRMQNLETASSSHAYVKLSPLNQRLLAMLENGQITLDELCSSFGWLAHTGRAAIARLRKQGFRISSQKVDGKPGYRLELETDSDETDSLWSGISRKVELFYRRRAAVLALAG